MIKKYILITIILLISLLLLALGLFLPKDNIKVKDDPYTKIIERINNKETFNLLISKNDYYNIEKTLNYYKDVYNINHETIKANYSNSSYKELIKLLGLVITNGDDMVFIIIKEGKIVNSLIGDIEEPDLKRLLIKSKLINKEYEKVDAIMEDDLKKYKNDKEYNILYISNSDKDLYKYRSLLVKNKIKSLILYANSLNQYNVITELEKALNINEESKIDYPILIKLNKGKLEKKYTKVNLDNLVEKCK